MPGWLKYLLIAIGLVLFVIRGGIMVLMPLLRFAIPALLIYGAYYLIKTHLLAGKKDKEEPTKMRSSSSSQTIVICAHCGQEEGRSHDCPAKKTF
ncbi:MAG: hypothetical protein ACOH5I_19200 [Oligoflexus sp.]